MPNDVRTAEITALVQPTPATIPAQLVPYVPPPQPAYHPAGNPQMPGVVVMPNGDSYYGFAPVTYAQPPADPKVIEQVALMNAKARMLGGSGVLLAGAGVLLDGVALAGAEISGAGLLGAALLYTVGKFRGGKTEIRTTNEITEHHQYDVMAVATGMFGRATGTISNDNSKSFVTNA